MTKKNQILFCTSFIIIFNCQIYAMQQEETPPTTSCLELKKHIKNILESNFFHYLKIMADSFSYRDPNLMEMKIKREMEKK